MTTKEKGITIRGHMAEANVYHVCFIQPYIEEGYHFVTVCSHIPDDDPDRDKFTVTYLKGACKDELIDLAVDTLFYPDEYVERVKRALACSFCILFRMWNRTGKFPFPEAPKYRKPTNPDWEWEIFVDERYAKNKNPCYDD